MEREIAREREAMSIHETVQTQKQYYLHNMRSAYSLSIGDCMEREREAMSICEMVKIWKLYYLCNRRSAYFPRERGYVHM